MTGIIEAVKRHPRAVIASVGLHVVLLVMLSLSLTSSEIPEQPKPQANTIKAEVVDAKKYDEEVKRRKQAEELKVQQALAKQKKIEEEKRRKAEAKRKEAERKKQAEIKRKKEAEKKRLAEIERKKKVEAERKRKEEQKRLAALETEKKRKAEEAEKKRLAEEAEKKRKAEEAEKKRLAEEAEKKRLAEAAERKRKEEEARQKRLAEEAEKRRLAEEAELKRRLAEEEQRNAEHNRMLNSLRSQYVRMIQQKVESKWLRPTTVNADLSCEVFVRQTALGDVVSVNLQECSNDVAFKNSIERAVWAASPLPPPPNPEVFENEIHFIFRPSS
ncbi:MAG: cell envelope integrity protein TolA [Thiotrichales bacterium]|nr:MAG: cell envelope integrity protein TolA [Thiotrichales bacterium]